MDFLFGLLSQSYLIYCTTATEFLRHAPEGKYDAVIVDSSDPVGMLINLVMQVSDLLHIRCLLITVACIYFLDDMFLLIDSLDFDLNC